VEAPARFYYVNFVRKLVRRVTALSSEGNQYLNEIEVVERDSREVIGSFGTDLKARDHLKLHILIPPRISFLDESRMKPLLSLLKQASVTSPSRERPINVDAWMEGDCYQFIDFPTTLVAAETWIQRHLKLKQRDPALSEWKRLEKEVLDRFELMLKWWVDDPENAFVFREHIRLIRFTEAQEEFHWLAEFWKE
jgi:hypothetical protein